MTKYPYSAPHSPYKYCNLVENQCLARHLAQYADHYSIRCWAIEFLHGGAKNLFVLQSCAIDQHSDVRFTSLEKMQTRWQSHFIVLTTLTNRAFDRHPDVQMLSIRLLSENWLHHPSAVDCLKKVGNSASCFAAKFAAIEALQVQDWKITPGSGTL